MKEPVTPAPEHVITLRRVWWIFLPVIALVALGYLALLHAGDIAGALAPYVSKQTGQTTELYFTDYGAMPRTVDPGKSYPVEFTIANHEGGDRTYTYTAAVIEDGVTSPITTEKVTIRDGRDVQRRVYFTPSQPGRKVRVVIELPDSGERISYSAQIGFG